MKRNFRLDLTIQRIIGSGSLPFDLELGAEQLLAADAHDLRPGRRAGLERMATSPSTSSMSIGLRTNVSGAVRMYTQAPPSIQ